MDLWLSHLADFARLVLGLCEEMRQSWMSSMAVTDEIEETLLG